MLIYGLLLIPQGVFARQLGVNTKVSGLRRSGWGPLHVTVSSPLQQKRLAFMHESPELPPPGSWRFRTGLTMANVWIFNEQKLMVDEDVWTLNQSAEYGVNDRFAVSARLPLQYLGGGFTDSFVEAFHDAAGVGNAKREQFPRNRIRMNAVQPDGKVRNIVNDGEGSVMARAPVISAKFRLNSPQADFPLTLKASLDIPRLEKKTNLVERSGNDWALALASAYRFSEHLAGTASYALIRSREGTLFKTGDLKDRQISAMASLDYQVTDSAAVIVQLLRESAVAEGTQTGFDLHTVELILGMKVRISEDTVWEFAFVENIAVRDNSADFALHAAISTTLN
ncbi:MAG: DUF3187 family protein [SAR324 cluster bacterium]|nr:DUF3187 family protein [SAR324 cluster bacterium]MCZ6647608.1 DUF3187 family protein [SAR324 cluster bacterium]